MADLGNIVHLVALSCFLFLSHGVETNGRTTGAVIVELNFTNVLDGIPGAEGPVFNNRSHFYMVAPEVEKNGKYAGQVLKVDLEKKQTSVLVEPSIDGYGGIPAGMQFGKDGTFRVSDMRLGILKVTPDGQMTQLAKNDSEGRPMQGCNDCIFDYQGSLWVTAPAGEIAPAPYTRSFQDPFGSVYCMLRDGQVIRVDTGIRFPNGLAVLHSDNGQPRKLIVAETPTKLLWGYDIVEPGRVANKTVWGRLPGGHEGGADGMDFDEDNNLLVAHWGSGYIEVFSPEGGLPQKRIKCPFSKVSNLHFHPQCNTVYVTEHDTFGLWKFEWERKGKPQYFEV
ncbi:diisopropyl-fluorophosphatase-like [Haliotis rufescens]|uniref:diisopropyl-fluorophosphatase-like n=1 Tax=Haliotis rufescens TaxID=6454 RepID=UPI00201E781E|nr:diisopropyl-fluorophosphatase-like [Haliotis rufescens]